MSFQKQLSHSDLHFIGQFVITVQAPPPPQIKIIQVVTTADKFEVITTADKFEKVTTADKFQVFTIADNFFTLMLNINNQSQEINFSIFEIGRFDV